MPKMKKPAVTFLLCLTNSEPDLQKGKLYKVLLDPSAAKSKHVRVIDDSGEDYLYPAVYFTSIELPQQVKRALLRAS
jgi:hypothetical protein